MLPAARHLLSALMLFRVPVGGCLTFNVPVPAPRPTGLAWVLRYGADVAGAEHAAAAANDLNYSRSLSPTQPTRDESAFNKVVPAVGDGRAADRCRRWPGRRLWRRQNENASRQPIAPIRWRHQTAQATLRHQSLACLHLPASVRLRVRLGGPANGWAGIAWMDATAKLDPTWFCLVLKDFFFSLRRTK